MVYRELDLNKEFEFRFISGQCVLFAKICDNSYDLFFFFFAQMKVVL